MSLSNKNLKSFKITDLENIYNIPQIANEYAQQPYNIGDYVNYQGVIYRCTTQILSGESWNSSHWTSVMLADDVRDNFNDLKSAINTEIANRQSADTKKVNIPLNQNNQPVNGTNGQSLRSKGDGTTEWADVGLPTDEQTATAISAWLDDHPEATTTVQDGSLTEVKFSNTLKLSTIKDYVTPQMFGAVGDGVVDDTVAIRSCIDQAPAGKTIVLAGHYKITEKIVIERSETNIIGLSTNKAKILCYGNGGLHFKADGINRTTLYDIRLYNFVIQNFTNNTSCLILENCYNVYIHDVTFTSQLSNNTCIEILSGSGIIFITECTLDGGSVSNTSTGIKCPSIGTAISIEKCNIWNLQTVVLHNGNNLNLLNVRDNWIERCNDIFISTYETTGKRVININLIGNTIAISNWEDIRIISNPKIISITGDSGSNYFNDRFNIEDNVFYFWDFDHLNNYSLIDFIGGVVAGSPITIRFTGNILTGKLLSQLGSYVYKNNLNLNYGTISIVQVDITNDSDLGYITDSKPLIKTFIPNSIVTQPIFINGINLNTNVSDVSSQKGRIYYDNGAFYFGVGGTTKTMPYNYGDDVKKIADTSTATTNSIATKLNQLINALVRSKILTSSGSE